MVAGRGRRAAAQARAGRSDRSRRRAPSTISAARLEGHPIQLDVSPDLPLVRVDPQLFHHCLINLLENAAQICRSRARRSPFRRSASPERHRSVDPRRGARPPAGERKRGVRDLRRLEGSDRKGGTGLGLAIVKGFAEAMGLAGRRRANREDAPGRAASRSASPKRCWCTKSATSPNDMRHKVLVVDDEPQIRRLLSGTL